jgi:hypothetical protein
VNLKWTAIEEVFGPLKDSDYLDDIERRLVCLTEINEKRYADKGTIKNNKPKTLG